MPLPSRPFFSLLITCFLLLLYVGCGNKKPISSATSGLQAADEEEPSPQSSDGQPADSEESDGDAPADGDEPIEGTDAEPGNTTNGQSSDGESQPPAAVTQFDESILEVPDGDAAELAKYVERIDDELQTMSRNAQIAPP